MELYIIEGYQQIGRSMDGILSGSALTDVLVRDILIGNGYIEGPEDWDRRGMGIRRLPGGKPVLEPDAGLRFSVSHSGDFFACAVAEAEETNRIGLDLQLARPMREQRLARRYFTDRENDWLAAHPEGFFVLWTRKEAYAKYTGEGLAAILAGVPVLDREDVVFEDLILGDGYYGCICSDGSNQTQNK